MRPERLAISAEELSRHRHAVETLAARLQEAKAALAIADALVRTVEAEIERRTVRAPISGEVLQVELRAGEFALAGHKAAPLIVLARSILPLRVDGTSTRWRVCFRRRARHASRGAPAF